MNLSIRFPNLGISLSEVGKEIQIGSFSIAYYGITLALAMLMGTLLVYVLAKQKEKNPDIYLDCGFLAIVFALIGARIYYVIFRFDLYRNDLKEILDFRAGGLAIYGGIIGGLLVVLIYSAKTKTSKRDLMDFLSCGLILGQIIGRWGNFFNREAFGGYTNGLFAMQLPVSAVRSADLTDTLLAHAVTVDGESFISVHPTFLYESLWNLIILLIMLFVLKNRRYEGQVALTYLAGYGLGRAWIEGLRTDSLLLWNTSLPVSQVLSIVVFLAAAVLLAGNRGRKKETGKKKNVTAKSKTKPKA